MCDIFSARPAFSTAATESPPPMMVVQPLPVSSARVSATSKVPLEKASNSKTPMGPFQMTVLQSPSFSWIILVDSGPLSRPIQPSGMESTETVCVAASAANLSATMTSVGRMKSMPFSLAITSSFLARSSWSSSTSDEPVSRPRALRKVKTMPPPMTILSTFSISDSMTPILDDTFEPPTMAANGRLGSETAPSRYSSSFCSRKPATEVSTNFVTPSVEPWARWAVPKASLTKRSALAASFSANSGTFFSSSL
mmetsp:Transcript_17889/g.40274  ORF Transcript_17889/g.40274 Transcript_17889/m.40274 type:complete len:253 (+) Transcript_17889:220-978(+)